MGRSKKFLNQKDRDFLINSFPVFYHCIRLFLRIVSMDRTKTKLANFFNNDDDEESSFTVRTGFENSVLLRIENSLCFFFMIFFGTYHKR